MAQQRVKARLQLEAFAHSGIDAMVLGDADLTLGLGWIGQQVRELGLPYVATNFTCDDIPMPTHRVVQAGDLSVGILGVIGREQAGACTFRAVVPAINAYLAFLRRFLQFFFALKPTQRSLASEDQLDWRILHAVIAFGNR